MWQLSFRPDNGSFVLLGGTTAVTVSESTQGTKYIKHQYDTDDATEGRGDK